MNLSVLTAHTSIKRLKSDHSSISCDGSVDPVDKLGDSSVDARFHCIGASQTPGGDTLQDESVLGVTHQRAAAVALRRDERHPRTYLNFKY